MRSSFQKSPRLVYSHPDRRHNRHRSVCMIYGAHRLSTDNQQIRKSCRISRRQHFPFHLPLLLNALASKVNRSPTVFGIKIIQQLHELLAACPRRVLIKEIKLSDTLTEEVAKHDAGFLIPMAVSPDFVQALYRRIDYVPAVLRGNKKLIDALLP